jgi:hypothetical protein
LIELKIRKIAIEFQGFISLGNRQTKFWISYSLGIEYSSYSISKLLQVFARDRVFRAQVLGNIPEQLEEVYQRKMIYPIIARLVSFAKCETRRRISMSGFDL